MNKLTSTPCLAVLGVILSIGIFLVCVFLDGWLRTVLNIDADSPRATLSTILTLIPFLVWLFYVAGRSATRRDLLYLIAFLGALCFLEWIPELKDSQYKMTIVFMFLALVFGSEKERWKHSERTKE